MVHDLGDLCYPDAEIGRIHEEELPTEIALQVARLAAGRAGVDLTAPMQWPPRPSPGRGQAVDRLDPDGERGVAPRRRRTHRRRPGVSEDNRPLRSQDHTASARDAAACERRQDANAGAGRTADGSPRRAARAGIRIRARDPVHDPSVPPSAVVRFGHHQILPSQSPGDAPAGRRFLGALLRCGRSGAPPRLLLLARRRRQDAEADGGAHGRPCPRARRSASAGRRLTIEGCSRNEQQGSVPVLRLEIGRTAPDGAPSPHRPLSLHPAGGVPASRSGRSG